MRRRHLEVSRVVLMVIGGVSVDDTFLPKDLWDGYKYFHMGHIYQDEGMIEAFNASKLGLQVKNQMKEGA
ncbi:hypothetical protein CYMTET_34393, partial [Cymbomonas tetramitiformis]